MGERNYISTTAGLLADVLYRQGRYEESAEFAAICENLASRDDVASQFHWRCVRGKLKARQGEIDEAESLLSAAMTLIETSDQLDLQGNGLLDFAEVRELAGAPADARRSVRESRRALRVQGKHRLGAAGTPAGRAPALDAIGLISRPHAEPWRGRVTIARLLTRMYMTRSGRRHSGCALGRRP